MRTSSPSASSITAPKMMLASGCAASPMISAASLTSNRPRSDGPDTLRRMPRALDARLEQRARDRRAAALIAASVARAVADAHQRGAGVLRIILTSAKSVLMSPGVVMRSVMPCTPWSSTSSAILNAFSIDVRSSVTCKQAVVRDDDERVDLLLQLLDAGLGLHRAAAALEAERPRDDADRERAEACAISATSGAPPVPVPPPSPAVMNTMSAPLSTSFDLVAVLLGGLAADLGVGARAEAARELAPDVELHVGVAHQQRLRVGVDRDELHALQAGVDHAVDGVAAAAADADDLDHREVVLRLSPASPASLPGDPANVPGAFSPALEVRDHAVAQHCLAVERRDTRHPNIGGQLHRSGETATVTTLKPLIRDRGRRHAHVDVANGGRPSAEQDGHAARRPWRRPGGAPQADSGPVRDPQRDPSSGRHATRAGPGRAEQLATPAAPPGAHVADRRVGGAEQPRISPAACGRRREHPPGASTTATSRRRRPGHRSRARSP